MYNISIELPDLELYSITYDEGYFKFNDYSMKSNYDLKKLESFFGDAASIFFQTEFLINEELIESLNEDLEKITYEFARLLFDDFEKARAVFLALEKNYRFDEITISFEGTNNPSSYNVDGISYDVCYPNELISIGQQNYYDYLNDQGFDDLFDTDVINETIIKKYLKAVNIKKLAEFIRLHIKENESLDSTIPVEVLNDDKELVDTFIDMNDEFSTAKFIIETITENDLFDAWKFVTIEIDNEAEALNCLDGGYGGYYGRLILELNEIDGKAIYVFEKD